MRTGAAVPQAVQTASSPTTDYRKADGGRDDSIQIATVQIPTQQGLVNRLEQQRAEWMEPISQRFQISQVSQPTLPAVTPIFPTSEERSKAGRTASKSEADATAQKISAGMLTYQQQQELSQLAQQRLQAVVNKDRENVYLIDQRMQELRAALGQQTMGDRVNDASSGMLSSYAAGYVNALGTTQEAAGAARRNYLPLDIEQKQRELAQYLENIRYAADSSERQYWEYEAARAREAIAGYEEGLRESWSQGKSVQALADQLSAAGAADIARAKDRLNWFGQFLVDTGVVGGQMAGDAALGALVGTNANLPMVIRTFGEAAQDARRDGADIDQQILDGFGSAGIAYGVEKLSNTSVPFEKMFGQGGVDIFIKNLVKKYGLTTAAQIMQRFSQSTAGEIALSALGEGGEAIAADVLQFLLEKAIYGPDAQFDISDTGTDFLAAATLGGFGKLAEPLGDAANQAKGAAASFRDHLLEVIEQEIQKYLQKIQKHLR